MVHSNIQELVVERSLTKSERPKEKTSDLEDSVMTAIKDLIKQIEIAPKKYVDIDYSPLYNVVNELFIEFRDMINKRILFNKRKAEKLNNENGEITEMTITTTQQTEPAGKITQMNVEKVENEFENDSLENDEAAAMSSKHMQLPLVNDDDDEA